MANHQFTLPSAPAGPSVRPVRPGRGGGGGGTGRTADLASTSESSYKHCYLTYANTISRRPPPEPGPDPGRARLTGTSATTVTRPRVHAAEHRVSPDQHSGSWPVRHLESAVMELRQLEYFVTVAEERNFTRAAEKLHVAQPGVSAQIRRLERELGQELLDRSGRSVRTTEVGAAVLPYARAALAAVAGVRLAVDELTGLLRGHVAVGTVTSHNVDLPGLLADFHDEHPAVEITLSEADTDQLLDGLRTGRLDAALVSVGSSAPPGIDLLVIDDQPIVAAVGHQHELAIQSAISLDTLRGRPLISLPRGTGLRARLDEACAAAGFTPKIAFEAGDPAVLAELAARGLGAAILPGAFAAARSAQLHSITIERPALRGRLVLAWRAEGATSPAGRALISRARAMLRRAAESGG